MSSFPNSLVKLGPANPILLRVVTAGGRRLRHAFIRWGYLALLIAVLLVSLLSTANKSNLGELAKTSTRVFEIISYVQLGMICLLAPIFTAGAITQERDSRTYNILLSTPLTNAQIVLGSLLSRLFFVVALLLSGVPVFAITLFYGGVTGPNIALSFAIALTTGLFTGSLAISIAVFRLGSGKTVFWFYVFNAVYLVGMWMADAYIGGAANTTWLTGIHPFLSLKSVVNPTGYATPDPTRLTEHAALVRWYLQYPAYAYVLLTFAASMLLVVPSALVLRRISQRSDTGLFQYLRTTLLPWWERKERKSRNVWANPVAWREAATRAGLSARGLTRWTTIAAGLGLAVTLLAFHFRGDINRDQTRQLLMSLILLEFSVSLLVATNSSASAVTRERESQTLDLLLVTPITSRYYIWGKLRGLVSFMLPFAAVPTLTVLLVVFYDALSGNLFRVLDDSGAVAREPLVWPEVVLELPVYLTALLAFACMLGLQLSLKWSRTITAVMASVAVLAGICAALGVCGFAANAAHTGPIGIIFGSFSPFTGLSLMINPYTTAEKAFGPGGTNLYAGDEQWIGRLVLFASILTSSVVYCLIVWGMYRSMVKNFDMIIRRQHQ